MAPIEHTDPLAPLYEGEAFLFGCIQGLIEFRYDTASFSVCGFEQNIEESKVYRDFSLMYGRPLHGKKERGVCWWCTIDPADGEFEAWLYRRLCHYFQLFSNWDRREWCHPDILEMPAAWRKSFVQGYLVGCVNIEDPDIGYVGPDLKITILRFGDTFKLLLKGVCDFKMEIALFRGEDIGQVVITLYGTGSGWFVGCDKNVVFT